MLRLCSLAIRWEGKDPRPSESVAPANVREGEVILRPCNVCASNSWSGIGLRIIAEYWRYLRKLRTFIV